jgi:hypothetical protein
VGQRHRQRSRQPRARLRSPVARLDPDKRDAVLFALSPIDEYRASVRRSVARDDEEEEEEEDDIEEDAPDAVVTPLPVPTPPLVLAPVA